MIIGDGYLPYHIRVYVDVPNAQGFAEYVKAATALKHEFEGNPPGERCHELVVERLQQITTAAQVYPFGGYSAVLGALKMIRRFGSLPCGMYGVTGTGPIAQAIQDDLAAQDIALYPTVRTTADSSLEIAIFDTQFRFFHEFQIHFLPMRDRGHILRLSPGPEAHLMGFLCSRPNNGRAEAAKRLSEAGRFVSLRVHGFSRFIRGEDYLKLVPYAQQVFVRCEEMRQLGPTFGVHFPRGKQPSSSDPYSKQLIKNLGSFGEKRRVVALAFHRAVMLYVPEVGGVQLQVPATYKNRVSDTRFHGALMVEALRFPNYLPSTREELAQMGDRALQAAYWGWDTIPPCYPDPTFACSNSWAVPSDDEESLVAPPAVCGTARIEVQRQEFVEWARRLHKKIRNEQ